MKIFLAVLSGLSIIGNIASPQPGSLMAIWALLSIWAVYLLWPKRDKPDTSRKNDSHQARAEKLAQEQKHLDYLQSKMDADLEWAMAQVDYRIGCGDFDRRDRVQYRKLYKLLVTKCRESYLVERFKSGILGNKNINNIDKKAILMDASEFKGRLESQ